MKKAKKLLSSLLPLLALPGLIMAAILPFFLPALKLLTLKAVMLNNMALSGAIFTLLRNNAFNDKYEHKIIYTNEGYKNEKHYAHQQFEHHDEHYADQQFEQHDEHYAHQQFEPHFDEHYEGDSEPHHSDFKPVEYAFNDDINPIEHLPSNSDWSGQVYIPNKYIKRKIKS